MSYNRLYLLLLLSVLSPNSDNESYDKLINIYNNHLLDTTLIDVNDIIKEEKELFFAGYDIYERKIFMSHKSINNWFRLDSAAKVNDIHLLIVSAYRSYKHQAQIIERKIKLGKSLINILKENKLPGFSEHHTGCAIDFTNKNYNGLSENFKYSKEYTWLLENAHLYNFYLTYSEDVIMDIGFEPWHWYYNDRK